MEKPTILFFSALTFGHVLSGRTEAIGRAFAKRGFKVIFVEFPTSLMGFLRSPIPGNIRQFLFPKVRIREQIIVIPQIPALPFGRFKFIEAVNRTLVSLWIRNVLTSIIGTNEISIALVSTPWWYPIIKHLNITRVYYDCIDDISVLCNPRDFDIYKKWEEKFIKTSSAVFVISSILYERVLSINLKQKVVLLPNGVDADGFKNKAENFPIPEDIVSIKKPVVGYIGGLSPWIDMELIAYCAKCLKNWSFVLVGPVTSYGIEKGVKNIPNVYLLGPKPYKYIPSYIKAFDVCLIPFKVDKMGDPSDPLKLYEYLSIGKPVVSTAIAQIKKLSDIVYIGGDKDSVVKKIEEAYKKRNDNINNRCQYALQNSWTNKTNEMIKQFNL